MCFQRCTLAFVAVVVSAVTLGGGTGHRASEPPPSFLQTTPEHARATGNDGALLQQIPWFECPDRQIEEIYYFRWRVLKKHLRQTPDGFVITEFLPPVSWAGKHNTISCAAGHHFREGRWLHDPKYVNDYALFWFRKGGEPRRYSFWAADSLYAQHLVTADPALVKTLLPELVKNYQAWESTHRDRNGLYWQIDDRDGMEYSLGGSGYRPTINSYLYGDALAIARAADLAGKYELAEEYRHKAGALKQLVQNLLWDPEAQFFKTLPRGEGKKLVDVCEEIGFVPWYFGLPDAGYEAAWKRLTDPEGFAAPFGPTTAERRHPRFMEKHDHDCLWNGPSWPYATTQTLVALANLLNDYQQTVVGKKDYLTLLHSYARSQHKEGKPWIAENLDARTGQWIVDKPRSVDYNHSGFVDLIITGLVGLRPRADDVLEVNPLVPAGTWDYFCLDRVRYHGRWLTIQFDKTGQRYRRGTGLRIFVDGRLAATSNNLERLTAVLPGANPRNPSQKSHTAGAWRRCEQNPVLGGKLGTCFDVCVLKEGDVFRMWFSWRPKASVALVESKDGIHWSEPIIVLGPNRTTDWEANINRPVVLKKDGLYHMWYTGQARGHSWIGHATSADGKRWQRTGAKPVLSPEEKWEKVAVMCPHVLWDEKSREFRMWYSGGEQNEPNAIGLVTSPDGQRWTRVRDNPIFRPEPTNNWEKDRVTGCQVLRQGDWYVMFYIGFRDEAHAQIGVARSRDGITGWQRHPANPIIRPGPGQWDQDAVYKPFAILDGGRWLLWYNGRRGGVEQIGLALHDGDDLGF
jgi:predicted GH43/DUF377 family glycosyl hydrolase